MGFDKKALFSIFGPPVFKAGTLPGPMVDLGERPKGLIMRQYETMVIIDAMISDDAINAEVENIGAMITNGGGEILRRDDWGKRKLAYTIKKRQHGYYVIFYYKAEAAVVANMEAALKLNENALRWMTLVDYPMSEIVYNQDMAQSTEEIIPVDAEEGEAE